MEPGGRNQWQPVANGTAAKTARKAKPVAVGCDPLPLNVDGKEGANVSLEVTVAPAKKCPGNAFEGRRRATLRAMSRYVVGGTADRCRP